MNYQLFEGVIVTDCYCSYGNIGFDGDLGYEEKRVSIQNTPAETFVSTHSPSCVVIENDVPFYAFGAINPDIDRTESPNRFFIDDQLIGTVQKGGFSTASVKIEPGEHRLFVGTYDGTCGHAVWGFHRNDVLKEPEMKKKIGVAVVAVGSWNAITKNDWVKVGGFDERYVDWGRFVVMEKSIACVAVVKKSKIIERIAVFTGMLDYDLYQKIDPYIDRIRISNE